MPLRRCRICGQKILAGYFHDDRGDAHVDCVEKEGLGKFPTKNEGGIREGGGERGDGLVCPVCGERAERVDTEAGWIQYHHARGAICTRMMG